MFYLTFIYLWGLYLFKDKIKPKTLRIISVIPMVLIIVLRFGFGADYFSYAHIYEEIQVDSLASLTRYYQKINFGYKLIMWPFKYMGVSFHTFFSIFNLVVFFLIIKWIKDNSSNFLLSTILFYSMFYFVWVLSAARQALVVAIALNIFFSKKEQPKFATSLFIVLLLSLVHSSAFVILIFLILDKVDWTQKKHIIFLGSSVVLSILPLEKVVSIFSFIPMVDKILRKYLTAGFNLFTFSSLVRLFFFVLVLFFYERYSDEKRVNYIDRLLYGFSIYFIFKFSEITASRLTIYTFVLLVIILPEIPKLISWPRIQQIIIPSFFVFSLLFVNKELLAMKSQSSYLGNEKYVPFETIISRNYSRFGKKESFLLYINDFIQSKKESFLDNFKMKTTSYSEQDNYILVEHKPQRYRLLNQDGAWLDKKVFHSEIEFVEGITITNRYLKNNFFSYKELVDLSGQERDILEMQSVIEEDFHKKLTRNIKEERVNVTKNDIPESLRHFYQDEDKINEVIMNYFPGDNPYYIMRVEYYGVRTFIYLDKDLEVMFDIIFKNAKPFEQNEMALVDSFHGKIAIRQDGKIIWWQDHE